MWGTCLGAAIVYFVPWLTTTDEPRDRLMFYGIVIVLLMILRPQGLIAERATARRRRSEAAAGSGDGAKKDNVR
ncbi:MAG: hypothetical protein GY791_03330 [Alphaproteobacteria bacterium]|nr:hypothetical protein [Alphaproteobacteria bacterium]